VLTLRARSVTYTDKSEDFIDDMLKRSLNIDSSGSTSAMMRPSGGAHNAFNFLSGSTGRSAAAAGQRFEEDLDISAIGQETDGDFDQARFNEFFEGNQVDLAYDKYIDLMRQSVSVPVFSLRFAEPRHINGLTLFLHTDEYEFAAAVDRALRLQCRRCAESVCCAGKSLRIGRSPLEAGRRDQSHHGIRSIGTSRSS
jgi:hypothetical protein